MSAAPCRRASRFGHGERYHHDRIRLAYLSADFHQHPTAQLMAELFERHDRTRFEVTAVAFGPDDGSPMRARLKQAFDHFEDVRGQERSRRWRQWLRAREIDIAVDLNGHTHGARPGIFAHRPAPVQVNYLVYPGTTGAPFMDYILADRIVLPLDQQPFFSEKIVHLPDCYQANDATRVLLPAPSRAEAGLPAEGFVFCCFNNGWKITRPIFDIWMRLLAQVEGSVLWLLDGPQAAQPAPGGCRRAASIPRAWSSRPNCRRTSIWRGINWPTCSSTPCPMTPIPAAATRYGRGCRSSPVTARPSPAASPPAC